MKKDHLRIISEYVGIFPTKINSALLSAQNRERWYWTNIRTKKIGLFDELYTDIPQPIDEGILLRDILQPENEVDKKYYISDKAFARVIKASKIGINAKVNPAKSGTITIKNQSPQFAIDNSTTLIKVDRNGIPKSNQDKADSLTIGGHGWGNHSDMDLILITHNLQQRNGKGQGGKGHLQKIDQKSYCLDTANAQAIEFTKNYVQWDISDKGYKSQQDRAFYEDTKHGTLSSSRSENKTGGFFENGTLRRLTPIECSRLQTIPEWYKWIVLDSQIYRMLGNGWTVDVIAWIISFYEPINQK
jgi:site-specific DNA-cytosine methylase